MTTKQMSAKQRISNLMALISDGLVMGFSSVLMLSYQEQLTNLLVEQAKDKRKTKLMRLKLR